MRKRTFTNNKAKMFAVVLGQCSEAMKVKLEGQQDWSTLHKEKDLVQLLKSIKVWMLNQQGDRHPILTTYTSIASVFRMRQGRNEDLAEFKRRFVAAIDVLEHIGVTFGGCLVKIADGILKDDYNKTRTEASDDEANRAETKAFDKLMAIAFIQSVDKYRFQEVATDLENMFLKGTDQYPKDVTGAYKILLNWTMGTTGKHRETAASDGLSFAQGSAIRKKNEFRDRSNDQCFGCGGYGHHQDEKEKCKKHREKSESMNAMTNQSPTESAKTKEADGTDFMFCTTIETDSNSGHLLSQEGSVIQDVTSNSFNKDRAYVIPIGSVGLDSMSSVDVFADSRLLSDIREADEHMRIICNAGNVHVTKMGTLKGYGRVWHILVP